MICLLSFYRKLNRLSVDVAVGSAVCCLFFARIFTIQLRFIPVLILVISVWSIYAADHLMDAKSIKPEHLTDRRRFYLSNFKAILFARNSALILAGTMSMFLYLRVMIGGIVLSAAVIIYFMIKERVPYIKELFCGAIYCAGILLAPLLNMTGALSGLSLLVILQFVLTVILNLVLFSLLDHDNDELEQQISFARYYGKKFTIRLIIIISIVQYVLIGFSIIGFPDSINAVLVILSMNVVLTFIFSFRKLLQKSDGFRLIGDAIFVLPLFYLLVS